METHEGIEKWLSELPAGSVVVEVPVKMPSWNYLLAMNRFKRAKVRHLLHQLVSLSSVTVVGCAMRTESVRKPQLMGAYIGDYYRTIQPNTSKKSASGKSRSVVKRKKKPY
jgi:hypothetical protein